MKYDGYIAGEKLKEAVMQLKGKDKAISKILSEGGIFDQIGDFKAAAIVFQKPQLDKKIAHSYTWEFLIENDIERIKYEVLEQIKESQAEGDLPVFVDKG